MARELRTKVKTSKSVVLFDFSIMIMIESDRKHC
jgi:hypothetical protein